MISLNYHHLYYFWTTAKAGSVTRASEQLLLAQPTMSLQIRQLETALGKKLLERHRDGVRLTEDGKIAFEYCERIFTQGEALLATLKRGASAGPAPLRLGVSRALSREIVTRVFSFISARRPGAPLTLFEGSLSDLQDRLSRHVIDVAIADSDFSTSLGADYVGKLAATIPVVFAASPRHRNALKNFPRVESPIPVLLRLPENPLRKSVEDYLNRHKVRYTVAAETDDSDLLRVLAAEGHGVAAISTLNASQDAKTGHVLILGKGPTGINRHVWVIASRHEHPDVSLRSVIEQLFDKFTIRR